MVKPSTPTTYLPAQILEEYALESQPFMLSRVPETYFNTESSQILLNVIGQHLCSNNSAMLISGEKGIGKTSFIESILLQQPFDNFLPIPINCTPGTSIGLLLLRMLTSTVAPAYTESDTHTIIKKSASFLFQQLKANKIPVLVIDDAHHLSGKTFSNLIKFMHAIQTQNLGSIKALLFGERNIEILPATLDSQTLNRDNTLSARMRSFSKLQTNQYLDFKFKAAGNAAGAPFTQKQLNHIQTVAGGVPLLIEQTAASLMISNSPFARWNLLRLRTMRPTWPKIFVGALSIPAAWILYTLITADNTTAQVQPVHPSAVNATHPVPRQEPLDTAGTIAHSTPATIISVTRKATPPGTLSQTPPIQTSVHTLRTAQWLLKQPHNQYTIQIMASWNRRNVEAYSKIISQQFPGDWIFYQTNRNGRKWHVLLYGAYPDHESASIAIKALPTEIRKINPWIRPLDPILKRL